jgi:hypothetical protein
MQGEQIGRIFAHWAMVFFGQFFRKQIFGLLFHGKEAMY